ncbi:YckD family protein [Desulfofundulus sp. TPOSR]|uniref:YckD family protein n=1 Tax=Desulfofundulus sp. TPOSR TaxID=2714340 RepID=UPI00140817B0|nr:YckD family protein [Desulfofundulus sp. TPOSR]NHM25748.1 YckD family protein [Desulfofundulus sp. TPOSR]
MKKKLVIILAIILVLVMAVPALAATVSAALTPEQAKELSALHQQIINLRKQMVDKYVEYGRLTPEQGQQIKANLDARQKFFAENPDRFAGYGPGVCPGFGYMGGRGGWRMGPGWGMMGGYWNSNPNPAPSTGS